MEASIDFKFEKLKYDFMKENDELDFNLKDIQLENEQGLVTNFSKEED